ncbi:MAG TPA: RnfABCDGE type electron transport complex subunit D [Thermoplasmata archaeon]|nr:RnfABCDGE type electron transport complex subunit D [Thermoplasmata archaeon]
MRWRRVRGFLGRWLPPARLTWLAVLALGVQAVIGLGAPVGVGPLLILPAVAVLADLLFQRLRFPSLRFPDAALATGAFLAVLLPPTVIVWEGAVIAGVAVGLRHALRFGGRPWFNPAALGLLLGAAAFGMAPAWGVAIGPEGELLLLTLAGLVIARSWRRWRVPASFWIAFAGLSVLYHALFGGATSVPVLLLSIADPSVVFFACFMVTEPRSAPSDRFAQPLFGVTVAAAAAFSPLLLPTVGLPMALLAGNLLAVGLRWGVRAGAEDRRSDHRPRERAPGAPRRSPVALRRWGPGPRAALGVLVLLALAIASAGAAEEGVSHGGIPVGLPGGGSGGLVSCANDTTAVSSSTLRMLHGMLGPSVVLSYDSNTGVVVFYDPVNQVTVTETDIYEDHGVAEFNGDDYVVPGCVPGR